MSPKKQLEERLNEFRPAPSPRFYRRLARAPWTPAGRARSRLFGGAVAALLLAVGLMAATPQGRAWAQGLLRFFTRAAESTQQLPVVAVTGAPDGSAPAATLDPASQLPFQDACGSLFIPHCSTTEIRSMVAFPVMELALPLDGMRFVGATGGPDGVALLYQGEAGSLLLEQGPAANDDLLDWQVGPDAVVETVPVGDLSGEYVRGSWFGIGLPEDGSVAWDPESGLQTLRWERAGLRYTLWFFAAKTATGPAFGAADLAGFASNLTDQPVAAATPAPHLAVEEAAALAGFAVVEPAWLPSDYAYDAVAYNPAASAVCLYYRYPYEEAPSLAIAETPAGTLPSVTDLQMVATYNGQPVEIAADVRTVPVGGALNGMAQLAYTGLDASRLCGGEEWSANMALLWQAGDRNFIIFGHIDQYDGRGSLTQMEAQQLAEGLTGVATIPAGTPDPGRLASVEAAESLAGFDVLAPAQLPAGLDFAYAVYRDATAAVDPRSLDSTAEVLQVYLGAPTGDGYGIRYWMFVSQQYGTPLTLEELAMGGGYEWVTVRGQPAVYRQMCWEATAASAAGCTQTLTWYDGSIFHDIETFLPGALAKEDLLAIAEGMR